MADLKSVPYPRWPEAPRGLLRDDLVAEGLDPEQAEKIASVLERNFSRMADENMVNWEFGTEELRDVNALIEYSGAILALTGESTTGTAVVAGLDTIQRNINFTDFSAVGDPVNLTVTGIWMVELDVRFTDDYRGGADVSVTRDGNSITEAWPSDVTTEPWNRWTDQLTFFGRNDEEVEVTVTANDAGSHNIDVTFRLTLVERLKPGYVLETFFHDTVSSSPTAGSETLVDGTDYTLTIKGNFRINVDSLGGDADAILYPSDSPGSSGPANFDYDNVYATGLEPNNPVGHMDDVVLSLDGGSTFAHVEPVGGPYSGTPTDGHEYTVEVTGEGFPLQIDFPDSPTSDNNGKLKVTVQER